MRVATYGVDTHVGVTLRLLGHVGVLAIAGWRGCRLRRRLAHGEGLLRGGLRLLLRRRRLLLLLLVLLLLLLLRTSRHLRRLHVA